MNGSPASESVDIDTWRSARLAHMEEEKALTRQRDELSRKRRELPRTEVSQSYEFTGPAGPVSLIDLFDGRGQLAIYHFMYGPDWDEGCPSCSFWADNFDGIGIHLAHRDTALAAVSRASLEQITAYKDRMGWSFPWVSSLESSFNFDMGVSFTPAQIESGLPNYNFNTQFFSGDEAAGVSIFTRDENGRVFLTYQTFSRGLDMLNGAYHFLDLTPAGRDEDGLPWTMAWLERHDNYAAD
jgi:predicted dithiol-disulfide oxidoreductase (DUF899 family)